VLSTIFGIVYGIKSPEYNLTLKAVCAAEVGNSSEENFGASPKNPVILIGLAIM
jgi:hypothetical protein